VVRYKDICDALGSGSPRSVGSALRNNPFAPYVPCHRVVASDLFVGGYCGQWGEGHKVNRKKVLLESEGVCFDSKGYLDGKNYFWNPATMVQYSQSQEE
jgi:methylated-DNA-[protein]-cysteine S-methyltransferase